MKRYYIYDGDKLIMEGYSPDLAGKLPFAMNTLYKYAVSGKIYDHRYKIVAEEHSEIKYRKQFKDFERYEEHSKFKDAKALRVIKECLEEFGNTNLVKRELKFLPQLEKEYRLNIVHYEAKKKNLMLAGINDVYCEDWIITWLDWEK